MFSPKQKIRKQLSALITRAEQFGLAVGDINVSREFLNCNEYGMCLDHVVAQLYEFEIPIDNEFYNEVEKIAILLSLPEETYSYISALISK